MSSENAYLRLQTIILICATLLTSLLTVPLAWAQGSVNTGANVFPLDSKPYGATYGEWTAKWWQWALSIPKDINPTADTSGKNCALKQSGPVWFLSGTAGGAAVRTCSIPVGKAILLPLLNADCSYLTNPNLKTESQLLSCAKSENEGVTGLDATIDGVKIQGLQHYRVQSPLFNLTLPANNFAGSKPGTTQAVSDGYWVLLKPLPVGSHTIHMAGSVVNYAAGALNNFANEVTYHITVS